MHFPNAYETKVILLGIVYLQNNFIDFFQEGEKPQHLFLHFPVCRSSFLPQTHFGYNFQTYNVAFAENMDKLHTLLLWALLPKI